MLGVAWLIIQNGKTTQCRYFHGLWHLLSRNTLASTRSSLGSETHLGNHATGLIGWNDMTCIFSESNYSPLRSHQQWMPMDDCTSSTTNAQISSLNRCIKWPTDQRKFIHGVPANRISNFAHGCHWNKGITCWFRAWDHSSCCVHNCGSTIAVRWLSHRHKVLLPPNHSSQAGWHEISGCCGCVLEFTHPRSLHILPLVYFSLWTMIVVTIWSWFKPGTAIQLAMLDYKMTLTTYNADLKSL